MCGQSRAQPAQDEGDKGQGDHHPGHNLLGHGVIVVLLGGLFAGIAGMIFAVPVASVLKFLIPRLYQSFFQSDELKLPGHEKDPAPSEA